MREVEQDGTGTDRIDCKECQHGTLRVSDAVYADCNNCNAAVLRTELGI